MSIYSFLDRLNGFRVGSSAGAKSYSYEDVFKGEASCPATEARIDNFLPGLRPVEYDVDAYFKDVFAGSVF